MIRIFIFLIIVVISFYLYIRFLEKVSIFHPEPDLLALPSDISLQYEDITLHTPDKEVLHGWFVSHPRAKAPVLFLHGNAGNISGRLGRLELFHRMGLNTLLVDYRGYGKSTGIPTEQALYIDVQTMFDYLKTRNDTGKIIVYGSSLGGVYAIDLATKRSIDALIVEATFTSAKDMAKYFYPFVPSFMVSVQMNSIDKIGTINVPKIFFHGPRDEVVPYVLGRKLFDAASEPKKFVDIDGEHVEGNHDPSGIQAEALGRFFVEEGFI